MARFAETYGQHLGTLILESTDEAPTPSPLLPVVEEEDQGEFHREWAWMDYV
jgi:hypothetical protein